MTLVASCEVAAPQAHVFSAVTSEDGHREWFAGVKTVEADPAWPAPGSHLVMTVAFGRFDERALEHSPPDRFVLEVTTPTSQGRITHTFTALAPDRTLYTKEVEPRYHGVHRLFSRLYDLIIERAMRREVARAAAYAQRTHPS